MSDVRYPTFGTPAMPAWRTRFWLIAPLFGIVALAVVTPSEDGLTICPIALFTGNACPGCGMTRALSNLVRGEFGAAFTLHPLVVLIAAQLAGAWFWFMLRTAGKVKPMKLWVLNTLLIVTAVALLATWVVRYLADTLPPV